MFSFDEILNNTAGGATIVSQNHDVNTIAVDEASIRDALGGMAGIWDAAEMGISREEVERRIEAADTPERRAELLADLRTRAIRRASLDTSNGRVNVMVAGAAPWHKLGVNVAAAVNSAEAMRLAGIDWTVSKRQLFYQHPVGGETYLGQEEAYGIVRDDTGAFLGAVGTRYQPIQNAHGFDFLDSVLRDFGARYESAGSIFGGRKVWMLCHLPAQRFTVAPGDTVEPYALFTNCHDGSGQAWCFPTTERVVCANTFRVASRERGKGIGMRHTGDVRGRIGDAQAALGLAVAGFEEFGEAAAAMVRQPLGRLRNYVDDVLDAVLDVTAADALKGADALAAALTADAAERELKAKEIGRKLERRGAILDDILQRHDGERCGIGGIRGSVWAGFNAVTEFADHGNGKRRVGSEEARLGRHFEDVIGGDADDLKQAAFARAVEYMRA
jgi:phage/plasmid-like protein (TIGR03299 family)